MQRRLDAEYLRDLATEAAVARENGNGTVLRLESALPASTLERVAALLSRAPLGEDGD